MSQWQASRTRRGSSLRLLWVGHNLAYPPVRGVLQRNYNLLREAAKACEVHVLALDQPRTRPPGVSADNCVDALSKFCAHIEWAPLPAGVFGSTYWLGLSGLISHKAYDLRWLASRWMTKQLRRTLNRVKFDVVHFDTLGLAPYRRLVGHAGSVLNHHNVESSMMELRAANEMRIAARHYWRWEARKLLRAEQEYCPQFSLNLVVSPEDGKTLLQRVPGVEARVVANGVDTDYFTPRADPGGNTLLFCGGLDWYPNADALAYLMHEIWPQLVRARPNVCVVVVGRNPPKWLVRLSRSDHRIRVTGFVDDVRPYFREATVYICPVRVGGGTRLKVLDALAMGTPLVSTTFACSGLPVQNGHHVLLADTAEAFVKQVLRTLDDRPLRAKLAYHARELVCRQFSWPVVGRSLVLAYEDAAARASERPCC
jgi:glycosyltransferase involved in cell wall biosynthesis